MKRTRASAVLLVLMLVAAACGQKANVGGSNVSAGGGLESAGDSSGASGVGGGDGGTSTGGSGATGGATGATGGASSAGGGSAAGGSAAGGAASGGTQAGGGGAAAPAGDRTGITDKEIVIGIHAPVSGAAPFPQNSFSDGAAVYWDWLKDKGGVFGRNVRVVFEDDEFTPSTARRVCSKMVEQDKVFLLIGGGGADQITACANYANSVGVPYLSAGVNEAGLSNIRAYFALSLTYAQQSPMLAQLAKTLGKKVGIAVADTESFADAHASIQKAMKSLGLNIVYDEKIPKSASQAEALSVANKMRTSGAEVIYFLASPTTFLNVASAAGGQGYVPKYIGPARFLSPFPQLDVIDKLDPDYQRAYQAKRGKAGDDIGIALWGLAKTLHQMFLAAGKDMTRQSFVQTVESGKKFVSGVYPPVQYSATNHLGGTQAHLLQADCGSRTYKTATQFASSF
ncbi:MAG: branched-chain amino acid transport system substrate-binding protein [Actinomycetota bacterium]|nr:branched-chain amino acid transport system substrate-binding protein [Actinomycetota bacterium]